MGLCVLVAAGLMASFSAARAEKAQRVKSFGVWTAYVYELADRKVCFISARARKLSPKNISRHLVRAYVSNWTKSSGSGAREAEVSLRLGQPLKSGNSVTIAIDGRRFSLFASGETAFVAKRARERQLVKAMGRGRKMVVEARSLSGPLLKATYSLKGSGDALKYLRRACR